MHTVTLDTYHIALPHHIYSITHAFIDFFFLTFLCVHCMQAKAVEGQRSNGLVLHYVQFPPPKKYNIKGHFFRMEEKIMENRCSFPHLRIRHAFTAIFFSGGFFRSFSVSLLTTFPQ